MVGKSIEEIIADWNSELTKQTIAFRKHAALLAQWDRQILSNRHSLLEVEEEVKKVQAGQEALDKKLGMIETHQKEIHDALVSIEGEAEKIYNSERALMDSDAQERDKLYTTAEKISESLRVLNEELHATVGAVNQVADASIGDTSTPVGAIVGILNNQLRSLQQIEARTGALDFELGQLTSGVGSRVTLNGTA